MTDTEKLEELYRIFGSQQQLAKILNVTTATVRAWLHGKHNPQPYHLVAIRQAMVCVELLQERLSTREMSVWFTTPSIHLDDKPPATLLRYRADATRIHRAAEITAASDYLVGKLRQLAAREKWHDPSRDRA